MSANIQPCPTCGERINPNCNVCHGAGYIVYAPPGSRKKKKGPKKRT